MKGKSIFKRDSRTVFAHLFVIERAIIFTRSACRHEKDLALLRDLMDALHNTIPYLQNDSWTAEDFVEQYYLPFDEKYPETGNLLQKWYLVGLEIFQQDYEKPLK